MKLDRLLAIVILLLNRNMIQAKELADRFEVSVRTIYRDIETINQAGIPIVTYQGMNGGIGLAEGYRLDRNVLTNDELAAIVTALRSISTSYDSLDNQLLVEKISSIVPPSRTEQFQLKSSQVLIDFAPWGSPAFLEQKLVQLKQAIDQYTLVRFTYVSAKGEVVVRRVHPYTLILKGQKWYLQAFCLERQQFRLFKLQRMKELILLEEFFERQPLPPEVQSPGQSWFAPENTVELKLRFDARIQHLVEEWFSIEVIHPQADNSILVRTTLPEDPWLYGFILSFGPDIEVLEPEHLRHIIHNRAQQIANIYSEPQS